MRKIFFAIVGLVAVGVQAISVESTVEVIAGVMDGVIHKNNLNEITTCISNAEEISEDLEKVWEDFEEHSISSLMDSVQYLGKLTTEIPVALQNCENISGDIDKFENWASIFIHPTDLYSKAKINLPLHFREILGDIKKAKAFFD